MGRDEGLADRIHAVVLRERGEVEQRPAPIPDCRYPVTDCFDGTGRGRMNALSHFLQRRPLLRWNGAQILADSCRLFRDTVQESVNSPRCYIRSSALGP